MLFDKHVTLPLCLVALISLIVSTTGSLASEGEVEQLQTLVWGQLEEHRFDDLEKLAQEFRNLELRFHGGNPKLYEFYRAAESRDRNCFCESPKNGPKPTVIEIRQQLEAWLLAKPDSVAAHLSVAGFWIRSAWDARGTGYASLVSAAEWQLMNKRLDRAMIDLKDADLTGDPNGFMVMQSLAQLRGAPRSQLDEMYEAGVQRYPTYFPLYSKRAELLQEKWFGRKDDLANYINSVLASPGGEIGLIAYSL
jgi:hypothetical protein